MSRRASKYIAACLALAALSACDRVEPTGPSETPTPSFESQGGNN